MALHPLGRLVQHDARSKLYALKPKRATTYRSVDHTSHIDILDQGDLGSCTGNATVTALSCDPYFATLPAGTSLDEGKAVTLYSAATRLDDISGTYKPTDTGSSGLAVAKAAQQAGLISGYQHAFSIDAALAALMDGPVITGIDWMSSFDEPDSNGLVRITSQAYVRGGHEIAATGYDADKGWVWFRQSWGPDWGLHGTFAMSVADWASLLGQKGDVTVFVPITAPAPVPTPAPSSNEDANLAAALRVWEPSILSRISKAGKVKIAGDVWMKARNL